MSNSNAWDKIVQAANSVNVDQNALANSSSLIDPNTLIGPYSASSGGLTIGTSSAGGMLTAAQITSILQAFQTLTPEEKAELEQLKRDHEINVKVAKLTEFKKLPPELRQFIVNIIYWKEAKDKIEATEPEKPERLKELEKKEQDSRVFSVSSGTSLCASNYSLDLFSLLPIPTGVTAEELKEAHIEATLEEEMINGEKEK